MKLVGYSDIKDENSRVQGERFARYMKQIDTPRRLNIWQIRETQ